MTTSVTCVSDLISPELGVTNISLSVYGKELQQIVLQSDCLIQNSTNVRAISEEVDTKTRQLEPANSVQSPRRSSPARPTWLEGLGSAAAAVWPPRSRSRRGTQNVPLIPLVAPKMVLSE